MCHVKFGLTGSKEESKDRDGRGLMSSYGAHFFEALAAWWSAEGLTGNYDTEWCAEPVGSVTTEHTHSHAF